MTMFHVKQFLYNGISINDHQSSLFDQFYKDVILKNQVMNLTNIIDEEEFHVKHYLDSLMLVKAIGNVSRETFSLIDIGTGAGFPGIPLAIAFPNLKITMIDSLEKRINFINEEIDRLELKNATAIHGRAEDLAREEKYREKFDYAVSRAVANLSTLSEYALPFVHIGGGFLPYKSTGIEEELRSAENAIGILGGEIKEKVEYTLPCGYGKRQILVINKKTATPDKYPRKAGKPSKTPL